MKFLKLYKVFDITMQQKAKQFSNTQPAFFLKLIKYYLLGNNNMLLLYLEKNYVCNLAVLFLIALSVFISRGPGGRGPWPNPNTNSVSHILSHLYRLHDWVCLQYLCLMFCFTSALFSPQIAYSSSSPGNYVVSVPSWTRVRPRAINYLSCCDI